MQVTFEERREVLRRRELNISHPGVAKDHRETVDPLLRTGGTGVATFGPVALRHLSRFGFIPELGEDRDRRPNLAEIVVEDGGFAGVALILEFLKETYPPLSGVFRRSLLDIQFLGVQLAGFFRVREVSGGLAQLR